MLNSERIESSQATAILDDWVRAGRTICYTLVFANLAAVIQTYGKLQTDSRGQYFIAEEGLNCILNPDRFEEVSMAEINGRQNLRFYSPSDFETLPVNVILSELHDDNLPLNAVLTEWIH